MSLNFKECNLFFNFLKLVEEGYKKCLPCNKLFFVLRSHEIKCLCDRLSTVALKTQLREQFCQQQHRFPQQNRNGMQKWARLNCHGPLAQCQPNTSFLRVVLCGWITAGHPPLHVAVHWLVELPPVIC